MYHGIRDVMQDYEDGASAAGVSAEEMLTEDQVRDICHEFGRYEEIDRDDLWARLWEATGGLDLLRAVQSNG